MRSRPSSSSGPARSASRCFGTTRGRGARIAFRPRGAAAIAHFVNGERAGIQAVDGKYSVALEPAGDYSFPDLESNRRSAIGGEPIILVESPGSMTAPEQKPPASPCATAPRQSSPMKARRRLFIVASIAVSAASLFLILRAVPIRDVITSLRGRRPALPAAVCPGGRHLLANARHTLVDFAESPNPAYRFVSLDQRHVSGQSTAISSGRGGAWRPGCAAGPAIGDLRRQHRGRTPD